VFSCLFFKILYRAEAVVCHNVVKVTVQHTAMKPMQCFVSVAKEMIQAKPKP